MHSENEWLDATLGACPVMAILRGFGPERTLQLAEKAWDLGVTLVEVPIQSTRDIEALEATVAAGKGRGLAVGAGTVIDDTTVAQARDAGAQFTVSPGFSADVVLASVAAGMPSIPGVATASEIQAAVGIGLRWLKAFPAARLTPAWFKDMAGPFPQVKFVATGGIDAGNAAGFLAAGASVVALGSALADPEQLSAITPLLTRA
ncbi:bifunctional 4-hydroxy-2-oxoglutarate aldolase/2-dehydro-3-deoxy-phosphogluconate aldolase [Humibacter sp. RRB41]|uniref:bifunctional 4-hydroxy-2-oxoglutarate aldolase/2-dehydro-3-deoxy-phosphogluconate aldolase n=1 Tax=Humibacter sp. RRB41 TaxID=2919946 RepID=UPI001FAAB31B|nr:bifunctional 4-hydroxy-2-oxoglutarate aldolase/2-dehydro-3-deoxy-phosphogluconate aldolase [Humibacter sp. RRB41]